MSSLIRVSDAAIIALHAAAMLAAEKKRALRTRDIARRLRVSEAHLSKVLQRLRRAGLVAAVRGPSGGFRLARAPKRLTLRQIYEAIEGAIDSDRCPLNVAPCTRRCILGREVIRRNREMSRFLSRTPLSSVRTFLEDSSKKSRASRGRRGV